MRVASHLGLPVAAVDTFTIGTRTLLVVERFDRVMHPDGTVDRVHQEDFCQATGTTSDKKYEDDGGPSLRRIAELLQGAATPDAVEDLLRAVTTNVLIGNGDAHAKNFSIMHQPSGALTLTPMYDLMCTLHYGDDRLAMYIDNVHRTNRVTAQRLANEAARWGLSRDRAATIINELLQNAPTAIETARNETEGVPKEMVAVVKRQLTQLQATK
jgi:serine/threonine-protein kinase HipA